MQAQQKPRQFMTTKPSLQTKGMPYTEVEDGLRHKSMGKNAFQERDGWTKEI